METHSGVPCSALCYTLLDVGAGVIGLFFLRWFPHRRGFLLGLHVQLRIPGGDNVSVT